MTHDPNRPAGAPGAVDDLQFDRAETATPPPPAPGTPAPAPAAVTSTCAACSQPITDVYFEANGKVICSRCRDVVLASQMGGSAAGRFFKATVLGILAGAVGAVIWFGVRKLFNNAELGIIAIAVGFLVGGAIRYASGGRGGKGYQFLALFITYISICANYVPDIYWRITHGEDAADVPKLFALAFAAIVSLAVPFMAGIQNIIGMLIIGFALWEAWQINRRQQVTFNGPYRLAPATGAVPQAAPTTPTAYAPPPPMPQPAASAPPPPPPNLGI